MLTINKSDRKTVGIVIELVSLVHAKRMRKPKTYNVMNLKIIISHATQNILDPKTKKNLGCLSKRACIEIFTVTIISLNILELYFVHDLFHNFGLF